MHNILTDQNRNLSFKIRVTKIEFVLNVKYLGVHLDRNLEWKEHIKVVSSKVSRAVGYLKHARSFLPLGALETLHTGIVEPHFRYCCSVWSCCGITEHSHIQKLQNRTARTVTSSRIDVPRKPHLHELGWKPWKQLLGRTAYCLCSCQEVEQTKFRRNEIGRPVLLSITKQKEDRLSKQKIMQY